MSERVWDSFLTEQDRAHQAIQTPRTRGFGSAPALLLIDVYRSVFGDRPEPLLDAITRWPSSCGLVAWEALPHIQALLAGARTAGIPVVHITGLPEMPSWREARGGGVAEEDPEVGIARRAEGYAILDEVAPRPGEMVLRKAAPSAFWGTPLVGWLRQLGVDSLLVCGESTSGCVRATVVDACAHRFKVTVAEECVFDRTEAAHAINLFDMAQKYADVLPVAEVTDFLSRRGAVEQAGVR
jgi:maleamate amidohydrolase